MAGDPGGPAAAIDHLAHFEREAAAFARPSPAATSPSCRPA